ncbi:MAG: hypothetical protein FWH54_05260 [Methanobrevibacter sp.]|nr:hypothetical protein [Methanobrevibacter sp.]MCL2157410.1 hypothetical protein [Methanobrevibacter sp.]
MIERIIQIIILILAITNTTLIFKYYESKLLKVLSTFGLILVIIGVVLVFFKY